MARMRCGLFRRAAIGALALFAEWGFAADLSCFSAAYQQAEATHVLRGEGDWFYPADELRFLSLGRFWGEAALDTGAAKNPAHRDPLEPIDDFNRQLADLGVRLLVVPVPPKALIYPTPLGCSRADSLAALASLREFYEMLRDHGVAALDLTEDYLRPEALAEGKLFCRTDSRWSGIGVERAAARIFDWLSAQDGLVTAGSNHWEAARLAQHRVGDLARQLRLVDEEEVELIAIGSAGEALTYSRSSPVLVLGDENVSAFHAEGESPVNAGLSDHLARLLGSPVDLIGVTGSGATASRMALMREMNAVPDYIKDKKVVIWCFSASEFTQADVWRFVPLPLH